MSVKTKALERAEARHEASEYHRKQLARWREEQRIQREGYPCPEYPWLAYVPQDLTDPTAERWMKCLLCDKWANNGAEDHGRTGGTELHKKRIWRIEDEEYKDKYEQIHYRWHPPHGNPLQQTGGGSSSSGSGGSTAASAAPSGGALGVPAAAATAPSGAWGASASATAVTAGGAWGSHAGGGYAGPASAIPENLSDSGEGLPAGWSRAWNDEWQQYYYWDVNDATGKNVAWDTEKARRITGGEDPEKVNQEDKAEEDEEGGEV